MLCLADISIGGEMKLWRAINKAKSITELNDIFENAVTITLGCINDVVIIQGYEGAINTDFIARKVASVWSSGIEESQDSQVLARYLAEKVFAPLRDLVESTENQCSLYQLAALTRIAWTPPQAPEFGHSVALKHAMVLGFLDRRLANW